MANTFNFGAGKWATKKGSVLAYNDENNNFKPLPFTFTRSSSATRVNKDGLIEVVGTDEPRIDYLNNADGHLLLEPSRTNLITYSQDFDNAGWSKVGTASITANTATSPDGTQNADTLSGATGTDRNTNVLLEIVSGLTSSTAYTFSIYIDKLSSTQATVYLRDTGTGVIISETVSTGTGFQRVDLTMTIGAGTTAVNIYIGNTDSDILLYGAQLEAGSYATSYIPTSGSSVTRAADTSADAGNAQSIGSSEGTAFIDVKSVNNAGGTSNCDILVLRNSSNSSLGVYSLFLHSSGNIRIFSLPTSSSFTVKSGDNRDERLKIAFSYSSGDFVCYINGVKVYESSSISLALGLDKVSVNASPNNGLVPVSDIKLYNTRLSNAELAQLTSL